MSNLSITHSGPVDPTPFDAEVALVKHVNTWGAVDEYALWSPNGIIGKLSTVRGKKCPVTVGKTYTFSRYKKGEQVMVKLQDHKQEESNGGN